MHLHGQECEEVKIEPADVGCSYSNVAKNILHSDSIIIIMEFILIFLLCHTIKQAVLIMEGTIKLTACMMNEERIGKYVPFHARSIQVPEINFEFEVESAPKQCV